MLINAANLHIGGGVQVAASVVSELTKPAHVGDAPDFLLSNEVVRNIETGRQGKEGERSRKILDVRGLDLWSHAARRYMDGFDAVFTLFGPLYRWSPPFRSVVGFAQPWIIYPDNECYNRLPVFQRLIVRLKYWIQSVFFRRADVLVVELEHVKQGLVRELHINAQRIHVIHNCVSSIFLDEQAWQPVNFPAVDCDLRLGFLGRNYTHKNTRVFPQIAHTLSKRYGLAARFFVTFTDEEWEACTAEFRAVCVNIGKIAAAQCPPFYRLLDAVVFPSLLECFSATPLEAMAMERPLFASDRPFNRDVCGEHAHYFDPLRPETAADQIARIFGRGELDSAALRAARDHAIAFASPEQRAQQYLAILQGPADTEEQVEH